MLVSFAFEITCSISISHLNCSMDSLSLYDGESHAAAMIGRYCGEANPPDFITTGNSAFIHFQSVEFLFKRSGFKLEYHPYNRYPGMLS